MTMPPEDHESAATEPGWMDPDVARAWYTARTLTDLGELTARFLEGELAQSPSHTAPPDPETTPLIPLLAAANRAGYVTENSQPGEPRDDDGREQRATVTGFADDHAFTRLMTAAAGSDLIITAACAGDEDRGPIYCITREGDRENTWEGGAVSHNILRDGYSQTCHPQAAEALCTAWQITLIDPQRGRNDHLWPVLETFTRST